MSAGLLADRAPETLPLSRHAELAREALARVLRMCEADRPSRLRRALANTAPAELEAPRAELEAVPLEEPAAELEATRAELEAVPLEEPAAELEAVPLEERRRKRCDEAKHELLRAREQWPVEAPTRRQWSMKRAERDRLLVELAPELDHGEQDAIQRYERAAAAELERRERAPLPTIAFGAVLRDGYRQNKAADPSYVPDWAAWQRVLGAAEGGPLSPSDSENRKTCNPPPKSNGFLGVGRGGKWWAGARAAAYPMDVRGEALGILDREMGLSRREAASRPVELAADQTAPADMSDHELGNLGDDFRASADGRDVAKLDLGVWEPEPKQRGARKWWKGRREAQRLQRGLCRIQADRQANCRRYVLGGRVGLHKHMECGSDGKSVARLSWAGLETCSSVWSCPECSRLIRARRATELGQLEAWAGNRAYLLTLTVAHEMGDDLHRLRTGLANAWRAVTRGAPWVRFRKRAQIAGYVRALEVKHGPHGWNPHLHIILIGGPGWPSARINGVSVSDWIAERWRAACFEVLGADNAPDLEHGTDLRPIAGSGYLVKMGMELALDWTKRTIDGGGLRRTPWQIATDYCRFHDSSDRELWIGYCAAMKGARQLTWSDGLRELAGIGPELDDATIARDEGREVGSVSRVDWEWLVKGEGEQGYPWTAHALEIGEAKGLEAMRDWIEKKRNTLHATTHALRIGAPKKGKQP